MTPEQKRNLRKALEGENQENANSFRGSTESFPSQPNYVGPYDPSNRTPTGEPLPGDTRNALQRKLDLLVTPNPRREEWQSGTRNAVDNFSRGVAENVVPLVSHPLSTAGGILKQAGNAIANPDYAGPGGSLAAFFRPQIESAVEDYQTRGAGKAIPHILGNLVGGMAVGELTGEAAKPVLGKAGEILDNHRVANISKAHEAVLADAGGDYVPREQSSKTLAAIRNRAAAHPELVKVINGKDPQAAYAAHVKILDNEIKDIDKYHDAVRKPVENYPVEPHDIISDFFPSASKYRAMPEAQQSQLMALGRRINQAQTLEDLNNLRIQLNEEDLGARDMQTEPSPGYKSSLHKATNAVRDAYYKRLSEVTGKDLSELKRTEGALKEEVYNAKRVQSKLYQKEVKAKTFTGRERMANVVSSAEYPSGFQLPLVSSAAKAIRGTELANIQSHLQTLYSQLPEHTPINVAGGMASPRGFITDQASPSSGQLQLPSSVIPNADVGEVDRGGVPNRPVGYHVKPEHSAYPHEQVIPGKTPAATGPTVPPRPAQFLQLPESAGPGGSKFVSREQVGPVNNPNEPPPLNKETSFERITPKAGERINLPQSGEYRVIVAGPNGDLEIKPSLQLPAPESKTLLSSKLSPSTVYPSKPQLPPVGYTFTGPDGVVRTVTRVTKDGTVTLKEVKRVAAALKPQ
jgi:hypothetical protein